MVLLNAGASSVRVLDALNIRRYVLGDQTPTAMAASGPRIKASAGAGRARHVKVRRHRHR
jgi:D-alanyl-D-alanine carboxypeptidase/D-alanyl-D-alanine endopeptidase (penicillin-binding protein 7)